MGFRHLQPLPKVVSWIVRYQGDIIWFFRIEVGIAVILEINIQDNKVVHIFSWTAHDNGLPLFLLEIEKYSMKKY